MPHRIKIVQSINLYRPNPNLALVRSRRGYHLIICDIRPINHSINQKHKQLIFS